MQATVYSIGHSTLSYEHFLNLLRQAGVTAVADVRTSPYSRHFPHFGKDSLKNELQTDGIAYSFLGEELGGRPSDNRFYCEGVADYERMAKAPAFEHGLKRVIDGAGRYTIALMCSERDPLDCHRCLLIGRALAERGLAMRHILGDGVVVDHAFIEEQLLKSEDRRDGDLFMSRKQRLEEAYRSRARKVAYVEKSQDDYRRSATGG